MVLRKLELRDAPFMLEWMHDENVTENLQANFAEKTLDDCIRFIENSWTDDSNIHYSIVDEMDEYMGTVSIKNLDRENAQGEFAIVIRSCAMGKGISADAMREIIKFGKERYGLKRIYWCVSPDNNRAVRFYRKNGYKEIHVDEVYDAVKNCYTKTQIMNFLWFKV